MKIDVWPAQRAGYDRTVADFPAIIRGTKDGEVTLLVRGKRDGIYPKTTLMMEVTLGRDELLRILRLALASALTPKRASKSFAEAVVRLLEGKLRPAKVGTARTLHRKS